jgi:hypothetical protein
MDVLVIGLNHQIQPVRQAILTLDEDLLRFEVDQKEAYTQTLCREITSRGVKLVGEETFHGVESIAERAARRLGIRYANIDMPPAERQARNIPRNYSDKGSPYLKEQKARWHREREMYMFERVLAEVRDADSILIVCGREHSEALARLFREAGYCASTSDLLREPWYVEDWFEI